MTVEKREIRVRLKGEESSKELVLAKYLNSSNTPYKTKEMIMMALLAYWLPFAYKDKFGIVDKECVLSCIYRLKLHQDYLLEMLGSEVLEDITAGSIFVSENLVSQKKNQDTQIQDDLSSIEQPEIKQPEKEQPEKEQPEKKWFSPF